jgi:hypothetical protein
MKKINNVIHPITNEKIFRFFDKKSQMKFQVMVKLLLEK